MMTPRRSPAARAWCRCWRSGWRSRPCWSTCASSPSCAESRFRMPASRSAPWCAGATSRTTRGSRTAHPLLKAAIAHVAHYQIRNRGTVGGSIAHADPAAEMPGIAVTCDAEIAVGRQGRRARDQGRATSSRAPLTTALTADEIIVEIRLPAWPARRRWGFQEFARRRGDFAHGGGGGVLRSGRAAAARATPMSASSASPTGRCGWPRSRRCSTGKPSTRRRSRRPKPRPPPPSIRRRHSRQRRLSPRARRHHGRARAQARRGEIAYVNPCRCDSKSTASRSRSRSSRG